MGHPPDENLPEVAPDQSPQALSPQESYLRQGQFRDQHAKYPVYVEDSPKFSTIDPKPGTAFSHEDVVSPEYEVPWESRPADGSLSAGDRGVVTDEKGRDRTICGLRRNLFWLLLAAVLVIIVASVGGGVGGGIAAAKARESSGSGANSNPTPTTSTSSTETALPTPLPTFLNNQTVPSARGFLFQAWSGYNYTGNVTQVMTEEGFFDLTTNATTDPLGAVSYVWIPDKRLSCCITFCVNTTYAGGYWCQEKRQTRASGRFPRIWIGCGDAAHAEHACS